MNTVRRYLDIPDDEIPEVKENAAERKYLQEIEKKKASVNEVRELYSKGHSLEEISRLTGHTRQTVSKYLKDDCPLDNGRYDYRLPGKLALYEQEVIEMRAKGITY